jgi:hypothetical protein
MSTDRRENKKATKTITCKNAPPVRGWKERRDMDWIVGLLIAGFLC